MIVFFCQFVFMSFLHLTLVRWTENAKLKKIVEVEEKKKRFPQERIVKSKYSKHSKSVRVLRPTCSMWLKDCRSITWRERKEQEWIRGLFISWPQCSIKTSQRKKQSPSYSCWSFGLSGQEDGWQDLRLTRGMSAMLLLVKCPSPLPNCFLSPKCSVLLLSFFQVLVRVCPLTSLSLGPHSRWEPKLDTGDLGCWYVPNVGGIQQLSECPRMRHSCVHISVASTRPRGPRGPSGEAEEETEEKFGFANLQRNFCFSLMET